MCSTVCTCKSGCIMLSFRVSSVSVSVPTSRPVPSAISRYPSAMASSISAILSASSVAPVLPYSDFIPVILLSLSTTLLTLSCHTPVLLSSFSTPVLLVWFFYCPHFHHRSHCLSVPHTNFGFYAVCGPPDLVFTVLGVPPTSTLLRYSH